MYLPPGSEDALDLAAQPFPLNSLTDTHSWTTAALAQSMPRMLYDDTGFLQDIIPLFTSEGCRGTTPQHFASPWDNSFGSLSNVGPYMIPEIELYVAPGETYQVSTVPPIEQSRDNLVGDPPHSANLLPRWQPPHVPTPINQGSTNADMTIPKALVYEAGIVHQCRYTKGRPMKQGIPPIQFHGFSLYLAHKMEYGSLADADSPAWSDDVVVAEKLAIVFCFPGRPEHRHQVHVRRTDSRLGALTRGKLASVVARELQTYMEKLQVQGWVPLQHDGADLAFERLVLVDVQHISKGSLQPTIGVVVRHN